MERNRNSARKVAVAALAKILNSGETIEDAIDDLSQHLSTLEKSWVREVVSGSLRWKGLLDEFISGLVDKKATGWLKRVLLISTYQLLNSEVQPEVIVNESVDLVRQKEGKKPAGFINAVLRKAVKASINERIDHVDKKIEFVFPMWIRRRLTDAYGKTWVGDFSKACLERPEVWLCSKKEGAFILEKGKKVEEYLSSPDYFVQNVSNQILVQDVYDELSKRNQKTVLDLCAAPGGKTIGMVWKGLKVVATDKSKKRIVRLKENLERLNLTGDVEVAEFEKIEGSSFDAVWVDAPCTGIGTIRKHPELVWSKSEKDLKSLIEIQQNLIQMAFEKLKPGGSLIYSVCSLLPEEGKEHFEKTEREWLLTPFEKPYGDGFWGCLVTKAVK